MVNEVDGNVCLPNTGLQGGQYGRGVSRRVKERRERRAFRLGHVKHVHRPEQGDNGSPGLLLRVLGIPFPDRYWGQYHDALLTGPNMAAQLVPLPQAGQAGQVRPLGQGQQDV